MERKQLREYIFRLGFPAIMFLKRFQLCRKEVNSKWRSGTLPNAIYMYSEKKLTVPAIRCFLIQRRIILLKQNILLFAALRVIDCFQKIKVCHPTVSAPKISLLFWLVRIH